MDIGIVSSRYAKALLKFALQHKQTDEVYEGMTTLKNSFLKAPKLKEALADPVIGDEKKFHLLYVASGQSESMCLERFFRLVLEKRRVDVIPFIAQSYIDAYKMQKNLILCQLTVPTQLNKSTLERIKSVVEGKTKKEVEFEVTVNPSIIGGFILEYDDQCLDASVAGRLRAIRKQIV